MANQALLKHLPDKNDLILVDKLIHHSMAQALNRGLAKFNDPNSVDEVVKILSYPSNYIYYNEIVTLLKELGVYENYKSQLRDHAFNAMKLDVN